MYHYCVGNGVAPNGERNGSRVERWSSWPMLLLEPVNKNDCTVEDWVISKGITKKEIRVRLACRKEMGEG